MTMAEANSHLLVASFVVLILGSLHILLRAVTSERPPAGPALGLAAIWAVGLALRLSISPRTFLHEYYHVAETIAGYLSGNAAPAYGQTGPALFHFFASALGRGSDVQVIFLTNAVLASLAIPAVALLDLALLGRWEHAICAAALLCVLPHHLRFSAAEDIFIQSITFGMWALALWAWHFRRPRLEVALIGAVALSLAVQTRPEMLFFPAALLAMVVLVQRPPGRLLYDWRTIVAAVVAAALLIPRALEMREVLASGMAPALSAPRLVRYLRDLVVFHRDVTPVIVWVLLAAGALWTARRKPGLLLWVGAVYVGWSLFSQSTFSNLPFHLRTQLLPTSYLVLIAAGAASLWMELWGAGRRRTATAVGATALAASAIAIVISYRSFVGERRDQQREWEFLERTVPLLPEQGTLLSTIHVAGDSLDAFPNFLLERDGKQYRLVDLRAAADGSIDWPSPGEDVYFYQGMFCYFAFPDSEPTPDPMTRRCLAVHDRYVTQPLFTEDLDTPGYSWLRYAQGPYRIGFYRLVAARERR